MSKELAINIEIQVSPAYKDKIDISQLVHTIRATLLSENVSQADLSLVITDDTTIRELNHTYRHIDAPTDVLAFAMTDSIPDIPFITAPEAELEMGTYLGDIIISYPAATRQAAEAKHTVMTELTLLTIHGVLHLLGYDHMERAEQEEMWKKQQELLETFR